MESILDVKEALVARSRTASIDDLRNQGKSRVRVIKAEHIAAMIREAVERALARSGDLSSDQAERLVEESRQEFQGLLQDRQKELDVARAAAEETEELRRQLEELSERHEGLVRENEELRSGAVEPGGSGGGTGVSSEAVMVLMKEIAELKANAQQGSQGVDISQALNAMAGTLNQRLDQLGKKVGISGAVEADEIKLAALFTDDGPDLESNMDSVEVEEKTGDGISSNLDRLRKLKGKD